MLDREGEICQKEVLTCGLYNGKWSEGPIGLGATVCTQRPIRGSAWIQCHLKNEVSLFDFELHFS
jgi:hypothetical protein